MQALINYQKKTFEYLFNEKPFSLLDIGCSGGIPNEWRQIRPFFRAIGVDINIEEIFRLNAEEQDKSVKYVAGNLELPPHHPIRRQRGHNFLCESHKEFSKTSAWDAIKRKQKAEKLKQEDKPDYINLKDLFEKENFTYLDFIKIDIDGPDFDVLQGIEYHLDSLGVLGLKLEVNFNGSSNPHDHSFHNTDRLLRTNGFELIDLEIRRYTKKALPGKFECNLFAQTQRGAVTQGDALYFKKTEKINWDRNKIIKIIFLLSLYGHYDTAAQIVTESNLDKNIKQTWLDYAANAQGFKSYDSLMQQWKKKPESFYKDSS